MKKLAKKIEMIVDEKPIKKVGEKMYLPIADNVYFTGVSYRSRVTVNGKRNSRNFSNKRSAVRFRNQILKKRR